MFNQMAKKVLSVAMAAAIAVAPYSTALASSAGAGDVSGAVAAEAALAAAAAVEAKNVAGSTVAGVKSTTPGSYFASTPAAVTTAAADVAAALGLANGERAYVTTWDVTAKSAPAATAALNAAAEAIGATAGPIIQFNLNKIAGGKLAALDNGATVNAKFQVPASFRGGNVAVVKVVSGGATTVLEDADDNPNTVTIPVSAGNAAYMIVLR